MNPEKNISNTLNEYLFSPDKKGFIARYPFRVDPITDDRPFFFNFVKPVNYVWNTMSWVSHFTYPVFMFKSLFAIVFLMVLCTIFLPLMLMANTSVAATPFRTGYILSFVSRLGLGFMFVEIPLIQKFILFLGQPLYAIATILSTLLISSGLGSLSAGRFSNEQARRGLLFVIFSLVVLLIIYIFLLPPVFNVFLGMQGMVRFLIAVILIIPLGMLMGIAFPMGIRLLENDGHADTLGLGNKRGLLSYGVNYGVGSVAELRL